MGVNPVFGDDAEALPNNTHKISSKSKLNNEGGPPYKNAKRDLVNRVLVLIKLLATAGSMGKRKQLELPSVEVAHTVKVSDTTAVGQGPRVSQNVAVEGGPVANWVSSEETNGTEIKGLTPVVTVTGELGVSGPNPTRTAETLVRDEQGVEDFWALLERVGYTIW